MPKTSAQIKAEMLKKKAAAKIAASKNKSVLKNKGKAKPVKPASKPKPKKPKFEYKKIKAKSEYNPEFQEETIDDKDLTLSPAKNKGEVKRKTTVKSNEGDRLRKTTTKNKKSGKVVVKRKVKDTSPDGSKRKIKVKTVSDDKGVLSKKTKRKDSKGFKEKEKRKVKVKSGERVGVKSKETMTGKKMGYKGKDTFKRKSSTTDKYGNVVGGEYTKRKTNMTKKDSPAKMKGSPYHKEGSPYHMKHGDSPMHKDLVGKQHNLPEHLKKKIKAAPQMKGSPYHMSNELKYGGPVIDQMKTLSQAGANKVLRHMKK